MKYIVFLDTNIYDAANYSFHNALFSRLKEYIDSGSASLQINSVVEGEVREHIQKNVSTALKAINKAYNERSLASFRKLQGFAPKIEKINVSEWTETVQAEFQKYLVDCNVKRITVNSIDVENIMDSYFNQKPPFEAKKPDEFKDAIAVSSLIQEAKLLEEGTYCVISDDSGFRAAVQEKIEIDECLQNERIIILESLKSFISLMEAGETHLITFLQNELAADEIIDAIKGVIEDIDICIEGIDPWIEEKGIVDIDEIEYEPHLIKINGDTNTAIVDLDVTAQVLLDYSYTDDTESYYDKEEGGYLWQTIIEMSEKYKITFDMVVAVDITDCWKPATVESTQDEQFDDDYIEIKEVLEAPTHLDVDEDDCIESEVISNTGPIHDCGSDKEPIEAYDTCPECGCPIGVDNDGGNGFCINCASNH